jgi:hypothetical protein
MPTIHFQGGSVEVEESYNTARLRINRAMVNWQLVQQGEPVLNTKGTTKHPDPAHEMSFTKVDDDGDPCGRVTINIEKYICMDDDELKDD